MNVSGFLRWLEMKSFSGEIVKDYGIISEHKIGGAFEKTSILLCKRQGKLEIVIKTAWFAYLSAGIRYKSIPASHASRIREIMENVEAQSAEAEQSARSPLDIPGIDTGLTREEIIEAIHEGRGSDRW